MHTRRLETDLYEMKAAFYGIMWLVAPVSAVVKRLNENTPMEEWETRWIN
jgi:hypothetical protein